MADIRENQAAWLPSQGQQLKVGAGPDQSRPADGEVIVRVAATAINPSEWKMQDYMYVPVQLPHVLGSDFSGTVVKVGAGVRRVKPGDRVIGHAVGLVHGGARHGSFQHYTAALEGVVAKIPDSLSFEQAAVLPLGISTAVCGLCEILKLDLPSTAGSAAGATRAVLIWGGASSMGTVAIQLALASGYRVVTTVSAKNVDFIRSLATTSDGRDSVTTFDSYASEVASQVISHIKSSNLELAGVFDSISTPSTISACAQIQHELSGPGKIATVLPVSEEARMTAGVTGECVYGTNPALVAGHPGIAVWKDFVSSALENGRLRAEPPAKVIGKGLDKIQGAMDLQKAGISAQKLVVKL